MEELKLKTSEGTPVSLFTDMDGIVVIKIGSKVASLLKINNSNTEAYSVRGDYKVNQMSYQVECLYKELEDKKQDKRFIRIKIVPEEVLDEELVPVSYLVTIVEQSHRYEKFTENGYLFNASNGVVLKSIVSPEKDSNRDNSYFLRGTDEDKDYYSIRMSREEAHLFKEAVEEYNEKGEN